MLWNAGQVAETWICQALLYIYHMIAHPVSFTAQVAVKIAVPSKLVQGNILILIHFLQGNKLL